MVRYVQHSQGNVNFFAVKIFVRKKFVICCQNKYSTLTLKDWRNLVTDRLFLRKISSSKNRNELIKGNVNNNILSLRKIEIKL